MLHQKSEVKVGSNHFVGEPLCVEVPVRVLRVFLGNVTSFWSTFVLGGGTVTFRGIQVPREHFIH